jgi:hypothetical protein
MEVACGGLHVALHIADHARSGAPDDKGTNESKYYKEAPEAHLTRRLT